MPISVRDNNKNNRWKRNAKKTTTTTTTTTKDRKEQGGTEAVVKEWELNNFVVRLSLVFSN